MKFTQPTFSLDLFERERQRQEDDIKAKQALKQQDKDRRKQILDRMAQRNKELTENTENLTTFEDDDLDCLDPEEEDARLGKRLKASLAVNEEEKPKKSYQVMRPPEENKESNRDQDDTIQEEGDEREFNKENTNDNLLKKASDKQKAMGY